MTHNNSGQTLIETIVAIFVLTSALSAGLGLTIYAFSHATISQNEIIASNLAREGIEVVRMMRDSNWLKSDVSPDSGTHLRVCPEVGGRLCYPAVFDEPAPDGYFMDEPGNWRIVLDPVTKTFNYDPHPDTTLNTILDYNLYLQPDGTYSHDPKTGTSIFSRHVNITVVDDATYPLIQNYGSMLIVKSVVAWRGRNCTDFDTSQNLLLLNTNCKVVVEEHLTNWKDYK